MADTTASLSGWERSLMAAEAVKERARRAAAALDAAGVRYAVIGGNAIGEWVGRVDEDAVRNTRDVDFLLRRSDFVAARNALEAAGFVYCRLLDADMFLDGPDAKPSRAVHILYADEIVKPDHEHPSPGLNQTERGKDFEVISLEPLVRMKLISWRRKDQVHLLDLIHVGLIDATWPPRFPAPLNARMQELLDDPDS